MDKFADDFEDWLVYANTATLPFLWSPYGWAAFGVTSALGGLVDLWQLGRAAYRNDYVNGAKNAFELGLSFVPGGKQTKAVIQAIGNASSLLDVNADYGRSRDEFLANLMYLNDEDLNKELGLGQYFNNEPEVFLHPATVVGKKAQKAD